MAKTPKSPIEKQIDEVDGVGAAVNPNGEVEEEEYVPMYRMYAQARVPVSSATGKMWKQRYDTALAKLKDNGSYDAWDEAISYYKNDQTGKRNRDNPDRPSRGSANEIVGGSFTNTENVVFANASALVPSIYAKNPDCTVHSNKGSADLAFTTCAQKLIRTLMQRRTSPGVNLKPKVRRGVVMTVLTNISWIEVGYTKREDASEGAMQEIDKLAEELKVAKDIKVIREIEGKLSAMDEKVSLLQPAGPWAKVLHPKDVIIDPDAQMIDGSDSRYTMIADMYETSFLNAVFREKDENGQWKSIFQPTHVMRTSAASNIAGHDEEITNFQLVKDNDYNHHTYGYDDERTYQRACRTKVWKVWDRTTRRVMWYADNDWKWPIWVWDDPYGFDDFYPLAPLAFHTDPEDLYARGEVSYYLDQQDEINQINSQVSKMRNRVSNQIVYDKNAIKNEEDVLNLTRPVTENQVLGINVPEGKKLEDVIAAPPIPAVDFQPLFDKRSTYDAIDRVSGVSAVVRGVEYRTNTTNKAIDSYESTTALRLDEKIDAIEECIGRVGYMILILCLTNMSKEEVVELIGPEHGAGWPGPMSARDAQKQFSLTVVGGSTLKPTSKVRKEQAKEVGQILGQFGANNPAIILTVLKMLQRAYSDELVLEAKDWDMIVGMIEQTMQAQTQPPGPDGGRPVPTGKPNGAAAPNGAGGGQIDVAAIIAKVDEMFTKMPPDIRKGVGADIAKGIPLQEILGKLQGAAQQAQQRPN